MDLLHSTPCDFTVLGAILDWLAGAFGLDQFSFSLARELVSILRLSFATDGTLASLCLLLFIVFLTVFNLVLFYRENSILSTLREVVSPGWTLRFEGRVSLSS